MSCAATAARSLSAVAWSADDMARLPPARADGGEESMHQNRVTTALSRADCAVRRRQRLRRRVHTRHHQRRTWCIGSVNQSPCGFDGSLHP